VKHTRSTSQPTNSLDKTASSLVKYYKILKFAVLFEREK